MRHALTADRIERIPKDELTNYKTQSTGQTADLKIDTETRLAGSPVRLRYWVERIGMEDGARYDDQISVEMYDEDRGGWVLALEYHGRMTGLSSNRLKRYR